MKLTSTEKFILSNQSAIMQALMDLIHVQPEMTRLTHDRREALRVQSVLTNQLLAQC